MSIMCPVKIDSNLVKVIGPYYFKAQKIVNLGAECIANEILIDFDKTKCLKGEGSSLALSYSLSSCLEQVVKFVGEQGEQGEKKQVFVNVEDCSLCDFDILNYIVNISVVLFCVYGVELVIEMTERTVCKGCPTVKKSLEYLNGNDVSLAMDDYDYVGCDFREELLGLSLFDYIKVDMPLSHFERTKFVEFVEGNVDRYIIVERVETQEQFSFLSGFYIYGVQGFLFCKGTGI